MLRNIFLAMILLMAALIGPSVALNPQYEIPISTCEGEGFGDGLLFDQYTYDAGYRVWESFVEVNGLPFYLSETGMVQYLGGPLGEYAERGIQYFIYRVDEFGEPIPGTYEGHNVGVNLDACEIPEPPLCDFTALRPEKIEIYEPVELGQEVEVDYIRLPSGSVETNVYMDGVRKTQWDGESCIIAEVWLNGVLYARNGMEMLD